MGERLVVIGGDAGGMGAASTARRLRSDLDIVALEKSEFTSYSACGIPYLIGGEVQRVDELVARTPQEFRNEYRIDVRMRHEALAIDLDRREVEVQDHEHDRTIRLGFDHLLIGTGARPIRPDLPGIDGPDIYGVQTLADGQRLLQRITEQPVKKVVVVGGGYIGLEMAEAFVRRGCSVTVVERSAQVMRTLDEDMGALVSRAMRRHGIEVRCGRAVGVRIAGRVLGWGPGEASVIGWLLQTKALIMIIFANILLDKQVITSETFTALLLMAVASTMLTVPVVAPHVRFKM